MPTDIAKYSIELFKPGGEHAGIDEILDRHADLKVARSIYRARVEQYPGRLIMLAGRGRGAFLSDKVLKFTAARNCLTTTNACC